MTTKDQDQQMTPPAQTLADLRRAAGLTQEDVAERMETKRQRVSHIEANYPNVRYSTLCTYIEAIGGHIRVTGITGLGRGVDVSQLGPDPATARTREYLKEKASKEGQMRINREVASAKELPLQGDQPKTGSDDPGRDVDQTDPQGNQGNGAQRQQP